MAFNINAHVILQGPKNISAVVKNIRTQFQGINVNVGVNIPKNVQNQINLLNKQLNTLNATNKKLTSGANSASSAVSRVGTNAKQASNAMQVLGKETALTFKRFAAAGLVTATFFKMTQAIGAAIPKALEFERGLNKLEQITGSTRRGLDGLAKTVDGLARSFGKDANEILEVAQIFAQTGQSIKQVESSIRAVARSSLAPTFGEMKQTAEGLVAALNQFGISAKDSEKVLGSLNRVSKKFAVESDDLIAAIRRAGGVFALSAGQFKEPIDALNEFNAIFTAVRSTTRENAETVATGLRTIFSRLQRRGTIDVLKGLGIELTDTNGKFKGLFESFRILSKELDGLVQKGDTITLSAITEELGGIRQIGKLIPAIRNFNKAERAFAEASRGAVEGLGKDVAKGLEPLIVQFERVRERFNSVIRTISNSSTFQALAKTAIGLANAFLSVAESLTPILPVLAKLATFKLAKGASSFFQGFFGSVGAGGGAGGVGSGIGRAVTGQGPKGGSVASSSLTAAIKAMNTAVGGLSKSTSINTTATNNLSKTIGILQTSIRNLNNTIRTRGLSGGGGRGRGRPRGFATGGLVPGQGNRDTVPAMLTPGEFVIKKSSVNSIGAGNLASMNYAAGGKVTSGRNYYGTKPRLKKSKLTKREKREIQGRAGMTAEQAALDKEQRKQFLDDNVGKVTLDNNALAASAIIMAGGSYSRTKGAIGQQILGTTAKEQTIRQKLIANRGMIPGGSKALDPTVFDPDDPLVLNFQFRQANLDKTPSTQIAKVIDANIKAGVRQAVEQIAQDTQLTSLGAGKGGMSGAVNKATSRLDMKTIEGTVFEAITSLAIGSPAATGQSDGFDFPNVASSALEKLDKLFSPNLIGSKVLEAKRSATRDTISRIDKGTMTKKILNSAIGISNVGAGRLGIRARVSGPETENFAKGGAVGTDTVPAMLTPGEFVINRKSAQGIGYGNLNKMNEGGGVPKGVKGFAEGGIVAEGRKFYGRRRSVNAAKEIAQNKQIYINQGYDANTASRIANMPEAKRNKFLAKNPPSKFQAKKVQPKPLPPTPPSSGPQRPHQRPLPPTPPSSGPQRPHQKPLPTGPVPHSGKQQPHPGSAAAIAKNKKQNQAVNANTKALNKNTKTKAPKGKSGGSGMMAAMMIPDLLFTVPMVVESLKQFSDGVEGSGGQLVSSLASVGMSAMFIAPALKEMGGMKGALASMRGGVSKLGKQLHMGGGSGFGKAFKTGLGRGMAQGQGVLKSSGRGLKGGLMSLGKGSIGKGIAKAPLAGAAAAAGPAIAGVIATVVADAIAAPMTEAMFTAMSGGEFETIAGIRGNKKESMGQAKFRGGLGGAFKGTVGGAVAGSAFGVPGAIVGGAAGGIFGAVAGSFEAEIEKVKFDNIVNLNTAAGEASKALAKLAGDRNVEASDIAGANVESANFINTLQSNIASARVTDVRASSEGIGQFTTLFADIGSGFADKFAQASEGLAEIFGTANLDSVEKLRVEQGQSRKAEGLGKEGKNVRAALTSLTDEFLKNSQAAMDNVSTQLADKIGRSGDIGAAQLASVMGSIDMTNAQTAQQSLFDVQKELGALGDVGQESAKQFAANLQTQFLGRMTAAADTLGDDADAFLGILGEAFADKEAFSSADNLKAATFKAASAINDLGHQVGGTAMLGALNSLTEGMGTTELQTLQNIVSQAQYASMLRQVQKQTEAIVSSMSKLTNVFEQAANSFDTMVGNVGSSLDSLLSGTARFELDETVNPFENLDLSAGAADFQDRINKGFADINAVGGPGTAGVTSGLEAAPAFAANFDQFLRDTLTDVKKQEADRGGKASTQTEVTAAFEKNMIAGGMDPTSDLGKLLLGDLEGALFSATKSREGGATITSAVLEKSLLEDANLLEKFGGNLQEIIGELAKQRDLAQKIKAQDLKILAEKRKVQIGLRDLAQKNADIDKTVGEITGTRKGTVQEADADMRARIGLITGGGDTDTASLIASQKILGDKLAQAREDERAGRGGLGISKEIGILETQLADNTDALKTVADDTSRLTAVQSKIEKLQAREASARTGALSVFQKFGEAETAMASGDFEGAQGIFKSIRKDFIIVKKLQTGAALSMAEGAKVMSGSLNDLLTSMGASPEQIEKMMDDSFKQVPKVLENALAGIGVNIDAKTFADNLNMDEALEPLKKLAEDLGEEQKAANDAIMGEITTRASQLFTALEASQKSLNTELGAATTAVENFKKGLLEPEEAPPEPPAAPAAFGTAEEEIAKLAGTSGLVLDSGGEFKPTAAGDASRKDFLGNLSTEAGSEMGLSPAQLDAIDKRIAELSAAGVDITRDQVLQNRGQAINMSGFGGREIDTDTGVEGDFTSTPAQIRTAKMSVGRGINVSDREVIARADESKREKAFRQLAQQQGISTSNTVRNTNPYNPNQTVTTQKTTEQLLKSIRDSMGEDQANEAILKLLEGEVTTNSFSTFDKTADKNASQTSKELQSLEKTAERTAEKSPVGSFGEERFSEFDKQAFVDPNEQDFVLKGTETTEELAKSNFELIRVMMAFQASMEQGITVDPRSITDAMVRSQIMKDVSPEQRVEKVVNEMLSANMIQGGEFGGAQRASGMQMMVDQMRNDPSVGLQSDEEKLAAEVAFRDRAAREGIASGPVGLSMKEKTDRLEARTADVLKKKTEETVTTFGGGAAAQKAMADEDRMRGVGLEGGGGHLDTFMPGLGQAVQQGRTEFGRAGLASGNLAHGRKGATGRVTTLADQEAALRDLTRDRQYGRGMSDDDLTFDVLGLGDKGLLGSKNKGDIGPKQKALALDKANSAERMKRQNELFKTFTAEGQTEMSREDYDKKYAEIEKSKFYGSEFMTPDQIAAHKEEQANQIDMTSSSMKTRKLPELNKKPAAKSTREKVAQYLNKDVSEVTDDDISKAIAQKQAEAKVKEDTKPAVKPAADSQTYEGVADALAEKGVAVTEEEYNANPEGYAAALQEITDAMTGDSPAQASAAKKPVAKKELPPKLYRAGVPGDQGKARTKEQLSGAARNAMDRGTSYVREQGSMGEYMNARGEKKNFDDLSAAARKSILEGRSKLTKVKKKPVAGAASGAGAAPGAGTGTGTGGPTGIPPWLLPQPGGGGGPMPGLGGAPYPAGGAAGGIMGPDAITAMNSLAAALNGVSGGIEIKITEPVEVKLDSGSLIPKIKEIVTEAVKNSAANAAVGNGNSQMNADTVSSPTQN